MQEHAKHGRVGVASLRAGMHRNTAAKYVKAGTVPSALKKPRTWRTREDPFDEHWPEIAVRLEAAPELEAKTLLEDLCERHPGRYQDGQLRTLQRRIRKWRALHGPEKLLFFEQCHRPGEAMQVDFTWAAELGVTIGGEPFAHQLCHPVLPYSNWEWVSVVRSESILALTKGVQSAAFRLGRVPLWLQTDNSSAATHDLATGKRAFNDEYLALVRHLGMTPRTTAVGEKEQNGDVEAMHRAFKRRVDQYLLLRGSRDFDSVEEYEAWLQGVAEKANRGRRTRLAEELAVMRVLDVHRLPEYREVRVRVSAGATIRVKNNTYSVPSRLQGEEVRVHIYEERIEVYYGDTLQVATGRVLGEGGHSVNYRHVIWSMVRKPGAFARYRYRDALFPTSIFRRAYEVLVDASSSVRKADIEYLRILHLAASTMEHEVEAALTLLLEENEVPDSARVKQLMQHEPTPIPELSALQPDLTIYDQLLLGVAR